MAISDRGKMKWQFHATSFRNDKRNVQGQARQPKPLLTNIGRKSFIFV
jgi:hypothetical protein